MYFDLELSYPSSVLWVTLVHVLMLHFPEYPTSSPKLRVSYVRCTMSMLQSLATIMGMKVSHMKNQLEDGHFQSVNFLVSTFVALTPVYVKLLENVQEQ